LESSLIRFSLNSFSISTLAKGTLLNLNIRNKQILIHDLSSIYLLARSQIEAYFMFYYLFNQPKTDSEGEFRFLLYCISGLKKRQEFNITSSEYKAKQNKELKDISILIERLNNNKFFQSLESQKQKDLLNRFPAKILGWERLIKSSNVSKYDFILQSWKLYSNYAHSEYISTLQYKDIYKNKETLKIMIYHTIEKSHIVSILQLRSLLMLFPDLNKSYNKLNIKHKTIIEFWASIFLK
ncbi:MAG: hypothetical protein K8R68_00725, partial [Bacteroidales bacterium]|nr:hypothetical protein [Bacteroidales bacterium]